MPKFISGQLKIDISFNDRTDKYKARLCPLYGQRKGSCETVHVGLPGSGPRSAHGKRLAVDDPRAFKSAAHAAISFARDDIQEMASSDRRGRGWLVRPARPLSSYKRRR